jgi:hypothetical protein
MADMATYRAIDPIPIKATAVAQARGLRVSLDSSGTTAAAAIGVRGDFVTIEAIEASAFGAASALTHGKVPALASEATVVGDDAWSSADGKWSKTSGGGAIFMGRWTQAASGDGVLGEVQLESVE